MTTPLDICSLDYLIGTLATAYKGLITSLIVKDFCMTERDNIVTVSGTALSMPAGNYKASLMCEGAEISKTELKEGYFELKAGSELIKKTKNLQIDILQNGRHIGTFLLKRERADEFFISAMELSGELKGVNFRDLSSPLKNKPGLSKKAESIISMIASAKKDWGRISEGINDFSKDLFWFDRESYYEWYEILARYSLKSCENSDFLSSDKTIADFLTLIRLPIENESDEKRLKALAAIWLTVLEGSSIGLAYHVNNSVKVLLRIHQRFPDIDISPALKSLISPLRTRIAKAPALDEGILYSLKDIVPADDLDTLGRHAEKRKSDLLGMLNDAEGMGKAQEYAKTFEIIDRAGSLIADDIGMIDAFFGVIERNINEESAIRLVQALCATFPIFQKVSPEAYKRATMNIAGLIKKMTSLRLSDACAYLLAHIGERTFAGKTDIALNNEVASAILNSGDDGLLRKYEGILRRIMIPSPGITGFSSDTWAEMANPLHLERLSKFLSIIRLDSSAKGGRFKDVLIHVICNLFVSGIFIPDDKLFQREVSTYLNFADLRSNFLLHYLLLRKLPVYFNEVGATGKIRDYTTEIDAWGNDPVLYFLRKQVHVNASNYNIHLIEEIINAWIHEDFSFLKDVVPEEALEKLNPEILAQYSAAIRPFFRDIGVLDDSGLSLERILKISDADMSDAFKSIHATEEIRKKIILLCRIYQEIEKKYSFTAHEDIKAEDICAYLLRNTDKIKHLKERAVSSEKTESQESLFFKRHIAFGIPSVMGSYHEPKFDALGELFRHEELLRIILEKVISIPPLFISCLESINTLFILHDLRNFQVEELLTVMKTNTLYLSQIRDLLRTWQKELAAMVKSLYAVFHEPVAEILRMFPHDELPGHLRGLAPEGENFLNRATDVIMRDMMNDIAGFTELDRILGGFIDLLSDRVKVTGDKQVAGAGLVPAEEGGQPCLPDRQAKGLPPQEAYKSDFFVIDELSDNDAMRLAPLIGGKAKNLVYLNNKSLPIPPGVVFTADKTSGFQKYTEGTHFKSALSEAVKKIEAKTGMLFGGDRKPLFLSVRSGSYLSMPGILSSILYCGMNQKTLAALIAGTKNPWLGWDSFRRFIEHYADVVFNLDPEILENIFGSYMKYRGKERREELDAEELREIVSLYRKELSDRSLEIPEDVYEQLRESVKAIYGSWHSGRALQFRKAMEVSEQWGTSVTLMQMISGNDKGGGASVFFTRRPFTFEKRIYGETKEMSTGDDLVYGKYANRPLSREQSVTGRKSLEEIDPELFSLHEILAKKIEDAMGGLPQEVEVTYIKKSDGKRFIYVLQTKRMESYRGFTKRFSDVCLMASKIIGRGTGVHGGALSGVASLSSSPEDIAKLKEEKGLPVILLRKTASTDDVSLMSAINGIVTITGGVVSHASILARKFELTTIVGCSDMEIREDEKDRLYAMFGNTVVSEGATISIDGSTGLIYSGLCLTTV